jgi:hypothetical protein
MHAPAGGLLLAEWIVDGAPTTLDAAPFAVERFATDQPPEARAASIMALADRAGHSPSRSEPQSDL